MKTLKDYFVNYKLRLEMLDNPNYYKRGFNACPLCDIDNWNKNYNSVWFCFECTQAQSIVPLTKQERIDFYYRFIKVANIPDPCPLTKATKHHFSFDYRQKLPGYAHGTRPVIIRVYLPHFSMGVIV